MNRRFILFFSAIVLTVFVNNLKAQAPTISYTPSTNAYPLGVTITNLTPTVTGTVPATTFSTVSTFVAASTTIQNPRGLCADASGNVYEADFTGNKIFKISSAGGTPTLIAGTGTASESDNTTGANAKFNGPTGVATDGTNLYVVDNGGSTIRKIVLSGAFPVTTIVSSGLSSPTGIDYDGAGNLYITDSGNNKIKKIVISSSTVTTIAGSTSGESDNNTGTSAQFKSPAGIVYDGSANLYVCDFTGHTVRKISTTSPFKVTTVAGTGTAGSVNSPGTASFSSPYGIARDASGILYVADEGNSEIRMVTTAGYVTTLAGLAGTAAEADGVGTAAEFNAPYCIEADKSGNLFVGDDIAANSTVRKILLTGYTISGTLPAGLSFSGTTGYISGMPTATQSATVYTITAYNSSGSNSTTVTISTFLNAPAISYSPSSNNYLVGTAITTLSPTNTGGVVGSSGYGTGGVIATGVSGADAMAVDASGNVYVTDYNAGKINEYTSTGTFIGNFGTGVTMSAPASLVFDSQGNCYVLDKTNKCVYKFNSTGTYQSTIISSLSTNCYGLAIDASDYIYIADYLNNTIKKYNTSGTYQSFSIATGSSTTPSGVAVDAAGNIYSLNYGTGKVAKYNAAGTSINSSLISGLNNPWAFSLDGGGNIYVGDSGNQLVKIYNTSGTLLASISGFSAPDGLVADPSGNLYVSDYNTNTVYKYPPTGGYYISDILPPGLSFDIPTGNITGTPTASFPATTYTVTAYNSAGNNSTTVTISSYAIYTWVGNAGGSNYNWGTAANWSPASVPGSSDQVLIGSTANFIQPPVVAAAAQVGSIILGTNATAASGITVNSTLTVNGAITYQSDSHSYQTFTATLSGSGSITATGLNVISNTTLSGHPYIETLASSVSSLTINGNVALTSSKVSSDTFNSTFNITGGTVTVTGAVQTTNTAGSTSTFAVAPTTAATLKLSNATALSGLSSLGTNTITFKNTGATVEYSGTAQTIYTDAAITGLSSGVSYQNIAFSGSGIKTASSGNLNIAGDFSNSYTTIDATNYLDLTSPTVAFNGTTQSLAGGSGNGTTFNKVTFSGNGTKTMASGGFYVNDTGVLTMSGTNVLTILAVGGSSSLTLVSDTAGTATVAAISNTAIAPAAANGPTITGNVTAQRFVSGGATYTSGRYVYRNYRLMSSPVNEGKDGNGNYPYSLNYLAANTIITDCTSTYGTTAGNPSLYLYNEHNTPSSTSFTGGNFIGVTNISNTVATGHLTTTDGASSPKVYVGDGYMMYFRGDKTTHLSKKTTYPYVGPESVTFTTTGALNQGTYNVVSWTGYGGLLYTQSNTGNVNVRGFNLVGNPYASSIDFSLFSNTTSTAPIYGVNVIPTIWIYNFNTNHYDTYTVGSVPSGTATNIIPSGQGFYVRSSNSGSSLVFRETAKITQQVTGTNSLLGTPLAQSDNKSYMRLKLITDSINNDDIVIGFRGTSATTFNENEDSEFMPGNGAPEGLASLTSDNIKASVKWLPLPKGNNNQKIKLFANVAGSGLYTFKMTDLKELPVIYNVWLMDNYKKDSLDIRANNTYAFNADISDTASFGSNRFSIVIRQNPALGVHLLNFNAAKATAGVQVIWKTENEQNYTNFTVERSINKGVSFDAIGGFSSNALGTYSLVDKTPPSGTDQYRLKMEDLNGAITYSKVVTLMYAGSANTIAINNITVYPNPSKGMLNLNIAQNDASTAPLSQAATGPITIQPVSGASSKVYGIKIVNSTGAVIKSTTTSEPNWQADLSSLTPGTYVIQVVNNTDKSLVGKSAFVKL